MKYVSVCSAWSFTWSLYTSLYRKEQLEHFAKYLGQEENNFVFMQVLYGFEFLFTFLFNN